MALEKGLIGVISITTLGVACSCSPPPDLCSRLELNMVALIGRPVSTVHFDKRTQTTFQIEERLWGVLPPGMISIDGAEFHAADRQKSWFILAGRRTAATYANGGAYFVNFECCPYGLLLPTDHAWVKEFRDNVAELKPATMSVEVKSNGVTLADFSLQFNGPGYSWRGISRESAINLRLPPGEYSVGITKPHFRTAEASQSVSVLPGACTRWWITAEPISSISGTIVDSRGLSAQGLHYSLDGEADLGSSLLDSAIAGLRRSWYRMMGWGNPTTQPVFYVVDPDSHGRFQVHVLPGKYRLSAISGDSHTYVFPPPIPKTYYPGLIDTARATEIVVPPGGTAANIYFELPDYGPTRRVEVVLVNEDGSLAPNTVVAHTGTYPGDRFRTAGWTQKLTDSHGRATFDVWQSLEYDLHIFESVSGDSPHIPAGSEPVSRRLVIHPWRPPVQR